MIDKKLEQISEWFIGLETKDTKDGKIRICKIKVNPNWVTPISENENIEYIPGKDEDDARVINVVGWFSYTTFDDVLDSTIKLIETNVEIELKQVLLDKKIEEMKQIFIEKSYDEIKNIIFILDPKKETQVFNDKKEKGLKLSKKDSDTLSKFLDENPLNPKKDYSLKLDKKTANSLAKHTNESSINKESAEIIISHVESEIKNKI